jgi:hypothetical protein
MGDEMIKPGDIGFFKNCKRTTKHTSPELGFKGYGFGLFLGVVPAFGREPTVDEIMALLSKVGFISFDDIGRLMGAENLLEILKKIEEVQLKLIEEAKEKAHAPLVLVENTIIS